MVKFGRVSRARPRGRRVFGSGFGVPFRVPWRPFGMPDGRDLGTLQAVLGHAEAVLARPLHEKVHVLVCTLLESFRPPPTRGRKFF